MGNLEHFIEEFRQGVEVLAGRSSAGPSREDSAARPPPVLAEPPSNEPAQNQIFIGMGHWLRSPFTDDDNGFQTIEHKGICLNNKGAHVALGVAQPFASLCDLVLCDDRNLWANWNRRLEGHSRPESFFSQFQLVVEDASPDSCLALFLFLARINGVPAEQLPLHWVNYVRRWELGDVISTGDPMHSFGALHNAIAHSYLDRDWHGAWVESLRFMVQCIGNGWSPEALPDDGESTQLMYARSLMRFEEQAYRDSLQYAARLQLRIPIKGTSNRYRLVDAYLAEEHIPLGSLKVFLRNDSDSTFLKSGYTLMAVHKPAERGSGNDMTVSLTPDTGLHLSDLWAELERMEDEAWGDERPCSEPRADLSQYPAGKRPDGQPAPNQPWYISPEQTLIGAPRRFAGTSKLGTRLDWDQVCDAIWRLYNPFKAFKVCSDDGHAVCLEQVRPTLPENSQAAEAGKRLIIAHWQSPNDDEPRQPDQVYIGFTPTLKRYLAACILRADHDAVRLRDLPDKEHFDFIELDGGFAVVTSSGAFAIDDWRSQVIDREQVRTEFENACLRRAMIDRMALQIQALHADIEKALKKGLSAGNTTRLLNRMAGMRLKVGQCWTETMTRSYDPGIIQFREALESRFGIAGKLELFYDSLDRIGSMLDSYIEYKTSSRIAFLTFYGFPIVLFSSLLGIALVHFQSQFEALGWTPLHLGIKTLLLFLVLVLLGMIAIRTWNWWNARRTRLRDDDFDDGKPSRPTNRPS